MHEGFNTLLKMKRKDLDEVNDEFYDFSLSSPARKIRRLDAELAPIIEEEEPEMQMMSEQPKSVGDFRNNVRGGILIEELPNEVENEERAIVLFSPINAPFLQSPSKFSISVSPDFVSGLKNKVLWSNQSNQWGPSDSNEKEQESNFEARNGSLAVVPWVPTLLNSTTGNVAVPQMDVSDMMEAEEMEVSTMDVEEDTVGSNQKIETNVNEGLHQWQQQHCMIPHPPQNTSTPIVWYR